MDTNDYVGSNEWALLEHPAIKNVQYYNCCVEPFVDLTFYVTLKRIAVFYNYILVLPCVLLSFLTLVIFWLPPESPAKILLGKIPSDTNTICLSVRPSIRLSLQSVAAPSGERERRQLFAG